MGPSPHPGRATASGSPVATLQMVMGPLLPHLAEAQLEAGPPTPQDPMQVTSMGTTGR